MQLPASVPPRFAVRLVEVGRERLARCVLDIPAEDPFAWNRMASDLHAFAGEASMMGLASVGDVARAGEDAARAVAARGITEAAREEMRSRLATLHGMLDELAALVGDTASE